MPLENIASKKVRIILNNIATNLLYTRYKYCPQCFCIEKYENCLRLEGLTFFPILTHPKLFSISHPVNYAFICQTERKGRVGRIFLRYSRPWSTTVKKCPTPTWVWWRTMVMGGVVAHGPPWDARRHTSARMYEHAAFAVVSIART